MGMDCYCLLVGIGHNNICCCGNYCLVYLPK